MTALIWIACFLGWAAACYFGETNRKETAQGALLATGAAVILSGMFNL